MADFGVDLSSPRASGAGVISPTRELDGRGALINLAGDMAKIFAQNQADQKQKEQAEAANRVISDFTREQTNLNDAVAQGKMSQAQAAARARANFSKYAANHPALAQELSKQNKSLFDNTGLGESQEAEQAQQDLIRQVDKDMAAAGYVLSPSSSPEFIAAQRESFQASRWAENEFKKQVARNAEAREAGRELRAVEKAQIEKNTNMVVATLGGAHLDASQKFITDIMSRSRSGEDSVLLQADVNRHFAQFEGALSAASQFNPEMAAGWRRAVEPMRQLAMDIASGKADRESAETRYQTILNTGLLVAVQDPEIRGLAVTSRIFNGNIPSTFLAANQGAQRAVLLVSQAPLGALGLPTIVGNKETESAAYSLIGSQVEAIEKGKVVDVEGSKREVSNLVNNILKQVGDAPQDMNAAAFNPTMDFLASSEYAKIIKYGLVDAPTAKRAKEMFQVAYEKAVTKEIVEKLDSPSRFDRDSKGMTIGAKDAPAVKDLIEIVPSSAGIGIQSKGGIADRTDLANQRSIQEELKPIVKVLNKLIHVGAHMEGHTDYARYWEDNKHNFLPNMFPAPAEGTKSPAKAAPKPATPAPQASAGGGDGNWWEDL